MPCVPWLPEKLHRRALEHFLTFVAECSLLVHSGGDANGYGSHIFQQRSTQHHRGNTLMAALVHRYHPYSRHGGGKLPRFTPVSAMLEIAHSWSQAKSFLPKRQVINRSKTGVGGSSTHGRFALGHVVQLRPAFGSSVANTTVGGTNLFGHALVVLLTAPREDGKSGKPN